jgi:hypothetical protein
MDHYSKNPIKARFQIIGDLLYLAAYHIEASIRWVGDWSARWIVAHKQRLAGGADIGLKL